MAHLTALILLCCLPNGQERPAPVADSIQLEVSRKNPYVGEQVEFTLTIRTAASRKPLEMRIPWLTPQETWALRWQFWLMQFTQPNVKGLPIRFHDVVVYAAPVKAGEYQLQWKLVMAAPVQDDGDTRSLSPIQVGAMQSNALTLQLQRPPLQASSATTWNLGVGMFRVSTSWSGADVVLGEETTLIVKVEGTGALESISPPPLRTMPGWENDRFLLEAGGVQWKDSSRWFTYRVRPRQLRVSMPPLMVSYFDPRRETTVTQQVAIPPLRILAGREAAVALPGSSVSDAVRHLPDFRRESLHQHTSAPWSKWGYWSLLAPAAWGIWIVLKQAVRLLAPDWLESLRWKVAARQARRAVAQSTVNAPALRQILADYFSMGLERPVSSDWDSLSNLALLSPSAQQFRPILEQLRFCEFGPASEENIKVLAQQTSQLFQQHQEHA